MSGRLLVDTHIAVWVLTGDSRLSPRARQLLSEADQVFVSAVSIWEIAVKFAIQQKLGRTGGAGDFPFSGTEALRALLDADFRFLDVRPEHAAAVDQLELLHGDPFDRLLIAQARFEPLHLLTSDATVARYGQGVIAV